MRDSTPGRVRRILRGVAAAVLAAGGATAVAAAPPAAADDCKAVGVISARGTWEPQDGSWLQKPMGDLILQRYPGQAEYTELTYPAEVAFDTSAPVGVGNLISTLNAEAQRCPDQRYVLLGYSQGAGVVGDALAAPSARIWGRDKGTVSTAASSRIAAIVLFGDIRFKAGEPYNVGTFEPGKESGDPPPRPAGALSAYASRIQDYCVKDDFVCQGTGNFIAHLAYFVNGMPSQGVDFAVAKLEGGRRA
ncbi:cutinase family protein [Actinomadura keratinilytica]|jgi:cutinase|uniref:Alpha/beta fold hydrolase n=1 Tax=Actinomadura keratinilytica TaxID=547461 RepID=A0ABP7Z359_9ACTN